MERKNKRRQVAKITVFITSVFVIFMSITYAFMGRILNGQKQVNLSAGVLDLVLEEEGSLTLSDAFPMADEVGMIQEDVFEFKLVNKTSNPTNYILSLEDVTPTTGEYKCSDMGEITANSPEGCRDVEYPAELRSDALKLCQSWYGEDVVTTEEQCLTYESYHETFERFIDSYVSIGYLEDKRAVVRYPDNYVTIDFLRLDEDNVKYYLTKEGVGEPKLISSITDGIIDKGMIEGNDTINYSLRLWIDSSVTNDQYIVARSLSYKVKVDVIQEIDNVPAKNTDELIDSSLDVDCRTYDDGVDTFLVGQCSNNYVWYSGKLWRVVLQNNETGAVKMVTDNAITAMAYNESGNVSFENSYADQWLRQEFLPTLYDVEDYLIIDSKWDDSADSSYAPTRPKGTDLITRTVGLLNYYEYFTTYNNSYGLANYKNTYLNKGPWWWLITPYNDTTMKYAYVDYGIEYGFTTEGQGIRPAVNLKPTINIINGDGSTNNPYILESDLLENVNGSTLLSTRYSGEYVMFNNELYRIVATENNLTKIIAVDKPKELYNSTYHNLGYEVMIDFSESILKNDLEKYYQNLSISNPIAYNMIEPNTIWYIGRITYKSNYKESICSIPQVDISVKDCEKTSSIVNVNIGLPRVGEMFTSQITKGIKSEFWTISHDGSSDMYGVSKFGYFRGADKLSGYGARPSMYLKSNVVIASDNTGNGTYEHPYKIELGQ